MISRQEITMFALQKQTDRDFTILNLTDVQAGDEDWDPASKNYPIIAGTIKELYKRVKPDLVTLSGDQAWALASHAYEALADLLDSYKVPWALVWGNHDQDHGLDVLDKTIASYAKHEYCLYENGPAELGRGNYVITICEGEHPVEALILMDTHDKMAYTDANGNTTAVWARLYPAQIEWYRQQIETLNAMGCKESLILTHIPFYAVKAAWSAAFKDGLNPVEVTPKQSYGNFCWNAGYEDSFGVKYDGICCHPEDDGFFEVIKALGSTKNCLMGHDHTSNFSISYHGVRFTYGLKTGIGCYWNPELNGGTVIKVSSNGVSEIYHEYVDRSEYL